MSKFKVVKTPREVVEWRFTSWENFLAFAKERMVKEVVPFEDEAKVTITFEDGGEAEVRSSFHAMEYEDGCHTPGNSISVSLGRPVVYIKVVTIVEDTSYEKGEDEKPESA